MSTVRLGDICQFINGGAWTQSEFSDSGYPVLKVSNCKPSGFLIDDVSYIPLDIAEKSEINKLHIHDVIIATVGSHPNLVDSAAGRSCIVTEEVCGYYLNQNAVCLRTLGDNILNQRYLGFLTQYFPFQHYIQNKGKGAANQMRIAISAIKDYTFELPEITIQNRVANILSAYDDLIENNQKQIKLLEEAAQRLYKEWFVDLRFPGYENTPITDGVPQGWSKELVGNVIEKSYRSKQVMTADYLAEGKIPIIDQSRDFVAGYTDDEETLVSLGKPVIVFGDHTRILKYIQFPFAKGADGTQLIISKCQNMPQSLLYLSLLEIDLSNYHYARHFKYLKAEEIIIPNVEIAIKFDCLVTPIFKKVQILRDQIINAQQARDRLLPKLMSGELEV